MGGRHITSFMVSDLGGWILTWKDLRIWNSFIELEIVLEVWLLDKDILTITLLMEIWKARLLPSNQAWFWQYQIVSIVKVMFSKITCSHWWDQPLSRRIRRFWTELILIWEWKIELSQNPSLVAKELDKNRWEIVSIS